MERHADDPVHQYAFTPQPLREPLKTPHGVRHFIESKVCPPEEDGPKESTIRKPQLLCVLDFLCTEFTRTRPQLLAPD